MKQLSNRGWHFLAAPALLAFPLSWRAMRLYRQMATLDDPAGDAPLPTLSIIVPARNEAGNLRRLLPSLANLAYNGRYEIIVVDDQSSDETAAVASAYQARVLRLGHLPTGWLGKTNACHQGAAVAQGEWLLFTDADTVHAADGPGRAVAYAQAHKLDGLSLFLREEHGSWLVKVALTAAFAALFAGLTDANQLWNGQYILLRRAVYEQSGGFAAVRAEPLEDLALGHHLRSLGYRLVMGQGQTAGRVQSYRDGKTLWLGLTRLGSGSLKWSGSGSLVTAALVTAIMTPLLALSGWLRGRVGGRWLLASWLAAVLSLLPWYKQAGYGRLAWFAPLGAGLVQTAATWGLLRQWLGRGLYWKGRYVK